MYFKNGVLDGWYVMEDRDFFTYQYAYTKRQLEQYGYARLKSLIKQAVKNVVMHSYPYLHILGTELTKNKYFDTYCVRFYFSYAGCYMFERKL